MKKMTTWVLAGIFTIFCFTGCSEAQDSTVTSEATTTVTTVTTTTTVPESVPESTTTTKETVTSLNETETTISDVSTETTTTVDDSKTTTKETTTQPIKKETTTTTKATTKETTKTTTKTPEPTGNKVILDVKNIQMLPELPSGSEVTCAAMVLNYLGINASKTELIKYLSVYEAPESSNVLGNPQLVFVGHPTKQGYGCYSPVLYDCINNYFSSNNINNYKLSYKVAGLSNCIKEIQKGNPVIIWATKNMEYPYEDITWNYENGDGCSWSSNHNCVVLIGYDLDKNTVFVNDPSDSRGIVEYPFEKVEKINYAVGAWSLVIRKKS